MGTTTFSGPIRAGDIRDTTGTTVGTNVRNVGGVVLAQHFPITQAGTQTALATPIVLPANSHIVGMQMLTTAAWVTTTTVSVGTSATATELVSAGTVSAIGFNTLTPGADATRTANWDDTGTADKRIFVISGSGTGGVGTLVIRYIQAHELP